jgi:hypothetical protein
MRKTQCLSTRQVQLLVARKNRAASSRTRVANQRSATERHAAAKEGLARKQSKPEGPQ